MRWFCQPVFCDDSLKTIVVVEVAVYFNHILIGIACFSLHFPYVDGVFLDIFSVHYQAHPADRGHPMMDECLAFLNREDVDPFLQSAVSHLYFVAIHP